MSKPFQLTTRGRVEWFIGLAALLAVSVGTVFGLTDDTLVEGEGSPLAQQYAAEPDEDPSAHTADTVFDRRFGQSGKMSTLILYDDTGDSSADAEMYAVATANLATHFGEAEIQPVADYAANAMESFDAVVYIGTDFAASPPRGFLDDVREGGIPVTWVDQNIDDLAGWEPSSSAAFADQYGWDPHKSITVDSGLVRTVAYKGRQVSRTTEGVAELVAPVIENEGAVEVLATSQCRDGEGPTACSPDQAVPSNEMPWAVRSGNLTYIAEIPLDYIDVNDVYLIYSDLFYDVLAPRTTEVKQAAVRLEDVGPESDPQDLRAVADYLHGADVPFQVAVMPIHVARTPDGDDWYGLSLLDRPEVVDALKYMQERGGTLIQHGSTHQFGATNNPYSGRTGEDYEFYRYGCSATPQEPYDFGDCENDSYIRRTGPVAEDSVEQHVARIKHGSQIMVDAGLGKPVIFETPHYAASVNAYAAMSQVYDARYEQSDYFAGIVSHRPSEPGKAYSQHFPYSVHDIYGAKVYPENLGNITETEQNNHAVRDPEFLISRAEANLVVRESTASFFFHPYLDLEYLKETVRGIKQLGFEFVPVSELK
ncbi:DUF2334 domain-containing protein [Kocuria sp. KH4]